MAGDFSAANFGLLVADNCTNGSGFGRLDRHDII